MDTGKLYPFLCIFLGHQKKHFIAFEPQSLQIQRAREQAIFFGCGSERRPVCTRPVTKVLNRNSRGDKSIEQKLAR
jgi:hypothetical protein